MVSLLLIHLDRVVRERIEAALRARGLTVLSTVGVEEALDQVDTINATTVLVDPRILLKEEYDISARFHLRTQRILRVIALTHVAGANEALAFQRHGASLLIAPPENLDLLALYIDSGAIIRAPAIPASDDPAETTHIENPDLDTALTAVPTATHSTEADDQMTPELEQALARARAEVRRIRAEHEAAQKAQAAKPPAAKAPVRTKPSAEVPEIPPVKDTKAWPTPNKPQPTAPKEAPADPRTELAAIAAPPRADGSPPRILVVEDDLGCRDFFQDVLAARGYHVHSCSSVPAAIRHIQRGNEIDLILSDINMPIFDGFELKWMLDNETRLAGMGMVPFLAVSAEDTPEKYSLALRLGAVSLIPKPVKDLKRFCKLVRATLEHAREPTVDDQLPVAKYTEKTSP